MYTLELDKIDDTNIEYYKEYEDRYSEHLKKYQSRIYPNKDSYALRWYHIKYDNKYIGSVWLEKASPADTYAVLGIFIAYDEYRGMGIGSKVISEIIKNDMSPLNIGKIILHVRKENARAISCYEKAGFVKTADNVNGKGISAYEMTYQKN